jgi:hypothetical protein
MHCVVSFHCVAAVYSASHSDTRLCTRPYRTVLTTCTILITAAGVSETGVSETGLMFADSDGDANGSSSSDELLVVRRRFLAGANDPEELQPLEVDEAAARTERRKRKVCTHTAIDLILCIVLSHSSAVTLLQL